MDLLLKYKYKMVVCAVSLPVLSPHVSGLLVEICQQNDFFFLIKLHFAQKFKTPSECRINPETCYLLATLFERFITNLVAFGTPLVRYGIVGKGY